MHIYVLQVTTGEELSIRNAIMKIGLNAYVPRENRLTRVRGEWKRKEYILFPSYVFAECELTDEIYYKIKAVSGAIKFLGVGVPEPISEAEAVQIGLLAPTLEPLEPSVINFDEYGTPRIVSGVLSKLEPLKINRHSRKALVELTRKGVSKFYSFSFIPKGKA